MISDEGLQKLLEQKAEGETLDFKVSQYPFVNASKLDKSELLKDMLAFANTERNEPAYILIGVDEINEKACAVPGIRESDVISDADLQQFIRGKTDKGVKFKSDIKIVTKFEGAEIAALVQIIEISHHQQFPVCAVRDYGRVLRQDCWVRSVSSSVVATPSEIAARSKQKNRSNILMPRGVITDLDFTNILNVPDEPVLKLSLTSVNPSDEIQAEFGNIDEFLRHQLKRLYPSLRMNKFEQKLKHKTFHAEKARRFSRDTQQEIYVSIEEGGRVTIYYFPIAKRISAARQHGAPFMINKHLDNRSFGHHLKCNLELAVSIYNEFDWPPEAELQVFLDNMQNASYTILDKTGSGETLECDETKTIRLIENRPIEVLSTDVEKLAVESETLFRRHASST